MKFSVIVPGYNANMLHYFLLALGHQTWQPHEVIVPCNTTDEKEMLKIREEASKAGAQFVGELQHPRTCWGKAVNAGIRAANEELLIISTSDTLINKVLLDNLFTQVSNIALADFMLWPGREELRPSFAASFWDGTQSDAALLKFLDDTEARFHANYCCELIEGYKGWARMLGGLVVVRRASLLKHDIWYDETFQGWGEDDIEFAFQCYKKGFRFYYFDRMVNWHVTHSYSIEERRKGLKLNARHFCEKWPEVKDSRGKHWQEVCCLDLDEEEP